MLFVPEGSALCGRVCRITEVWEYGGGMHWRDRVILAFCRVEPAGISPVMPGTCGSLAAVLLAPVLFMPLSLAGRGVALLLLFIAGGIAATRAERVLERKDPGEIVIDEVLGQWLTFAPFATLCWWEMGLGFALFRVFDIAKPWPVRASETWLPGGYGIMLDDAVAGLFAVVCLAAGRALWL